MNKCIDETIRPSWREYFKQLTELTATRSSCNKLHVGCILVNNNRIVAQGYNGFLPSCPHKSHIVNGHEIATIHAEQNTILDCAKRGVSCNECVAYITHYPCIICTRLLLASGIESIKYLHDYKNDPLVTVFTNQLDVSVEKMPI